MDASESIGRITFFVMVVGIFGCNGENKVQDSYSDDLSQTDSGDDPTADDPSNEALDLGSGSHMNLVFISAGGDPLGRYFLSNDFYAMDTEVTQAMFSAIMGFDANIDYPQQENPSGYGDDHPAYFLNWHMSAAFANAVTNHHNSVHDTDLEECYTCSGMQSEVACTHAFEANPYLCTGYRLPTEAEWEYAARSGTTKDFWTGAGSELGGTYSENDCSAEVSILDGGEEPLLRDYAWFCLHSTTTQPVGQKSANGFGLYDMHGLLQEWTADKGGCGDADPDNPNAGSYFPASNVDPFCPTGQHSYRIFRGGMFYGQVNTLAAGYRSMNLAEYRENHVGARLFLTHQEDIFSAYPKSPIK